MFYKLIKASRFVYKETVACKQASEFEVNARIQRNNGNKKASEI